MEYTRHTRYDDLTDEELGYLHRVQSRTFLNLANANVIRVTSFRVSDAVRLNAGLGHSMAPFGGFIDQKVSLAVKGKVKISGCLCEFENRNCWFYGAGVGVNDYPAAGRVTVSAAAHYWNQPVDLSFTAADGRRGGAVDLTGRNKVPLNHSAWLRYLSLDAGVIYKTVGFLPEELALGVHFGVRVGLSLITRGN